uniref:Uncharacterized protein n=1 Tax=Candidatus Kentrum sp. LPFa TaxID=2126335 RepID=A0A450WS74_9GAMM|nr:MAG: hypothetical protein BECKLPF1236A_GA0070988_102402 [Candidatus Kentron sp. LPFa]VFK33931.1 MAG: hypothetical protein BECKLPF1236C_GA0070990_102316 [Candidatus Kentron sp. LPFa]
MRRLSLFSLLAIVLFGTACAGPEIAQENTPQEPPPQEKTNQEAAPGENATPPTPARIGRDRSGPRSHHLKTTPFGIH